LKRTVEQERAKERTFKWESNNPEKVIYNRAIYRARKKGLPFNITWEDIIIPSCCPILGIPLKVNKGGRSGMFPDSPSLDRIVPELGYVKGNIRVISNRANHLKSDATLEEHRAILLDAEKNSSSRH